MNEYFRQRKLEILEFLQEVLTARAAELAALSPLGQDVCDRLLQFASRGKLLRGGLVSLGYDLAGGQRPAAGLVAAGAAMELFQAGLLIHDDIMDRDPTRRGGPSFHRQYATLAASAGLREAEHQGRSLALCGGDTAFFLAFELLAHLPIAPALRCELLRGAAAELAQVCVAQAQDVWWGACPGSSMPAAPAATPAQGSGPAGQPPTEVELLRLYVHKTGRYTFTLPLQTGARLAGAEAGLLTRLAELGEQLGVLFQLRDDELGLFGDEAELGKPVGSDVREGKQTLYHLRLVAAADPATQGRLAGIFGNPATGLAELTYVRELTEQLGVRAEVTALARSMAVRAQELSRTLVDAPSSARVILADLLKDSLARLC